MRKIEVIKYDSNNQIISRDGVTLETGNSLSTKSLQVKSNTKLSLPNNKNIRGIALFSDVVVKLTALIEGSIDTVGYGRVIIMDKINTPYLLVTPIKKIYVYDEIKSFTTDNNVTTLKMNGNYTHSRIIGNKVTSGLKNLANQQIRIGYHGDTLISLIIPEYSTVDADGNPLTLNEIANNIANGINNVLNTEMYDFVTFSWNSDESRFEIIAKDTGAINISVEGTPLVFMGLHDYTLLYGTDDFSGYVIELLDGALAGNTYSIHSIDKDEIVINDPMSGMDSTQLCIYNVVDKANINVEIYGDVSQT